MSARIVVADDDPDIRRLVCFTLKRQGHTILEADRGDAALDVIIAERPDLALLDMMMPGLTGLEVMQAVAANPDLSDIPVVFLSAKGQASEIDEGLRSGARAYIVKPFSPKELAAQIADVLAVANGHEGGHGDLS